jgi:hypothetical protein
MLAAGQTTTAIARNTIRFMRYLQALEFTKYVNLLLPNLSPPIDQFGFPMCEHYNLNR